MPVSRCWCLSQHSNCDICGDNEKCVVVRHPLPLELSATCRQHPVRARKCTVYVRVHPEKRLLTRIVQDDISTIIAPIRLPIQAVHLVLLRHDWRFSAQLTARRPPSQCSPHRLQSCAPAPTAACASRPACARAQAPPSAPSRDGGLRAPEQSVTGVRSLLRQLGSRRWRMPSRLRCCLFAC